MNPSIDMEKMEKIQNISKELQDVPWNMERSSKYLSDCDADVYFAYNFKN